MMLLLEAVLTALNSRKNHILLVAQAALPPSQYEAFRKLFLDQFGKSGFEEDLKAVLIKHQDRQR